MRARRGLLWIVPGALLLAAVVALAPSVLAPYLSGRLSAAAGVPVHVGWMTWNPFAGRVALHHLTVALAADAAPVVTIRSIAADIALRRLFAGDVVLRRLTVREPWVALRRTATGDFNLGTLLPASPDTPALRPDAARSPAPRAMTSPAPGESPRAGGADEVPARSIAIEALRVVGGSIEFHDETTAPTLETSLHLEDVAADDLAIALSGRTRVQVHVASRLERQPLTLDVAYDASAAGSHLTLALATEGVSLARTLLYVPLGWRRVSGTLDIALTYTREVVGDRLRTHTLTGRASGRDVALAEPWASEPTVRAAHVQLGRIAVDFVRRRTELAAVSVDGFAAVIARDAAGLHVPFAGGDAAPADTAWQTVIPDAALGAGVVVLRDVVPGADSELRATVRKGDIRTDSHGVRVGLETTTSAGGIDVDGRITAAATRLRLTLHELSLPELATRLRLPLQFATGSVDGEVDADLDNGARFSGVLHVAGGRTIAVDPARPQDLLAWQDLVVDVAEASVEPSRLHVRRFEAEWPYVMVHRAPNGVFPWTLIASADGGTAPAQNANETATRGAALTIDHLVLHHGRVEFFDTTLAPPFWTELTDSEVSATALAATPVTVERATVSGAVDEISPLTTQVTITAAAANLVAKAERLRLVPLNPYLEPILHYAITSGVARVTSDATLVGSLLEATNDVVLSRFGLERTGDELFQRQLGAPLSVALALMKDHRGDISLALPVRGDVGAQQYEVQNLVSTAITQALVGTLRAPVSLLGAIFRRDEEERFDLKAIPFAAGSAELGADGEARVGEVASLLARHTELDAVLRPDPSPADAAAFGATDEASVRDRLGALADARVRALVERLVGAHHLPRARLEQIPWTPGPLDPETLPGVDVQLRGK